MLQNQNNYNDDDDDAYRERAEALEFFKRIQSLGAYPPPTLCSLLVQLLAMEGMLEEADEQFVDLIKNGILPSEACATMMIRLRVQARMYMHAWYGGGGYLRLNRPGLPKSRQCSGI